MSVRRQPLGFSAASCTLLALSTLASPGCGPKKAPVEPGVAVAAAPVAQPKTTPATPVDTVNSPLQMLPAGTIAMFEGAGLARLAEIIERDALAAETKEIYSLFEGAMTQAFRGDILIPANAENIGVDPSGSVGVGYVGLGGGAFVSWATMLDRVRFRDTVIAAAKNGNVELQTSQIGSAEILRDKYSGVQVVLRDQVAMLAAPMHRDEEGVAEIGRVLATLSGSQSLAQSPNFKKATFGYNGQDGLGFANIAALAEHTIRRTTDARSVDAAQKELEAARARGETAEKIQALEANLRSEQEYQASYQRRLDARADLTELLFGGLPAVGMRVDAKRSGVMVEMRALQTETAFPRSVVRPLPGPAPILGALDGDPISVFAGVVEVDAAIDVIDRMARVDRTDGSWARINRKFAREFGVDLNADVRPELDGEFGFAITWDGDPPKGSKTTPNASLGLSAHAKVRDPAKAARVLKTFTTNFKEGSQRFKPAAGANHYVVNVPDWRAVHVAVVGDQLVVSTDAKFGQRLTRPAKPLQVGAPGAVTVLELPGASAVYGFDAGLLSGLFLLGMSSDTYFYEQEPGKASSRAYRKKYKEALKAKDALNAAQRVQLHKQLEVWREIAGPIGFFAVSAQEGSDDLSVRGGLFIRGTSIGAVIRNAIKGGMSFQERTRSPDVAKARDRFYQLQSELNEINSAEAVKMHEAARQ